MKKFEIYKLIEELNCSKNSMVLINEEKILKYKDIDDDTLELADYSDDEETDYVSFEIVKELDENKFDILCQKLSESVDWSFHGADDEYLKLENIFKTYIK